MEIEVGEWIRTKNGQIDIFEETDENYMFARCKRKTYWKLDIVKHSKNIIDLIEVEDYVNGYKVMQIEDSIYKNSKRILIYKNEKEKYERWIYIQEYNGRMHTQDDIVEILTKEQFEANCYKVGGEDE